MVVAIDEETYRTPPFKGSPTQTWTGEIGRVLGAIVEGGAKVVGFDIVFPTSIEQSEIPFGEGVFGERVRGFDRDFLRALAAGSAAGKVVLGEVLRGDQPIRPSPGQRIAVRQSQNIRALNVYVDSDDVVRRLPLTFTVDGKPVPSMALELASRATGARPEFRADGTVMLAGYPVPGTVPDTMTLNFEGGADDIPTYSFADLRACAAGNDKDFFRRQFDGKIVIVGTVLESEDRRVTSKRFTTGIQGARAPRCVLAEQPVSGRFKRSSIAGIYIHATAVNNLINKDAAVELGRLPIALIAALLAAFAALAARMLKPTGAVLVFLGAIAVYAIAATIVFNHALVLPLSEPLISGATALAAMVGYRFMVADRDRRLLQKSFALYLAPHVIEKMLASDKPPVLGGETRHVTAFFTDLEGFSQIAEGMSPEALMALMNEYLSEMTDIIESHGGYVDKYIGDSIVAVFGAPADDPDHAGNAARAALGCCARLQRTQSGRGGLSGPQAGATHRHQFRGCAGRQFRFAAALQLFGHERCGESGLAAGRRQQILRHHRDRLRNHGRARGRNICLARTRHHPGQGAQPSAPDFRIDGAGGGTDARASGDRGGLHRRARPLARRRVRACGWLFRARRRGRPAIRPVSRARKEFGEAGARRRMGSGPDAAGKVTGIRRRDWQGRRQHHRPT